MNEGIEIILDGKPHRVHERCSLHELVATLGLQPEDAATAVNGSFVPRKVRAEHRLEAGDSVVLFQPIVGG